MSEIYMPWFIRKYTNGYFLTKKEGDRFRKIHKHPHKRHLYAINLNYYGHP